ncbi:MAG: hypothetical protein QNK04_02745 [Myxococcota bacterium]|nr:hypothetical protein [Myxococcota bacterium]
MARHHALRWHPHLPVPHFHIHAPHVEWQDIQHPIRALALTAVIGLTAAVGIQVARDVPPAAKSLQFEAVAFWETLQPPIVPSAARYRGQDLSVDYMYGRNVKERSLDDMYRKPR